MGCWGRLEIDVECRNVLEIESRMSVVKMDDSG